MSWPMIVFSANIVLTAHGVSCHRLLFSSDAVHGNFSLCFFSPLVPLKKFISAYGLGKLLLVFFHRWFL